MDAQLRKWLAVTSNRRFECYLDNAAKVWVVMLASGNVVHSQHVPVLLVDNAKHDLLTGIVHKMMDCWVTP